MRKARDWYATDFEFRQLCGDAVSLARSEKEQEFAHEMMRKANEHGLSTFITEPPTEMALQDC